MNTLRTMSSSVRRAQSVASRFKRNVLDLVGHPDSLMTAFQLPAGVFTIVATGTFAICHCTSSVPAESTPKNGASYLIDNKGELVARGGIEPPTSGFSVNRFHNQRDPR